MSGSSGGMSSIIGSGIEVAGQQAFNFQDQGFNSASAKTNRKWQTEMSNTSVQRRVQDLIKAGINPVLAATDGAPVGSGAQAAVKAGQMPKIGDQINNAARLKMDKEMQQKNIEKVDKEIDLMNNQKMGINAKAMLDMNQASVAWKTMSRLNEEIENLKTDRGYTRALTATKAAEALLIDLQRRVEEAKKAPFINKKGEPNRGMGWLDYILGGVKGAAGTAAGLKSYKGGW
jgi:ATP-dependent protease HslVU (ClpYQ) ATPase subunit